MMHKKCSFFILNLTICVFLYTIGFTVEAIKLNSLRHLSSSNDEQNGDHRLEQIERDLATARYLIKKAAMSTENNSMLILNEMGVSSTTRIYRNPVSFFESYRQMEKRFKVYVYEEGEPPLVHRGPCKNIYTIEGRFIEQLEMLQPHAPGARTWDPHRAHAYFLPFSVADLVKYSYDKSSHDFTPLIDTFGDYVQVVMRKHPFWNRTAGADHFMLAAHDWGPYVSKGIPELYSNSIRALCNANTSEGFVPSKDVPIPRINLYDGSMPAQLTVSPLPSLKNRTFLAFFAGGRHGPIRPILFEHWKDRDLEYFPVYEYLPEGLDYYSFLLRSRFCLCPSGFEVSSPRIAEAIWAECVPVIISEGYVLPFSDVLQWNEFSISVSVADIPNLRDMLAALPEEEIERLREGVKAVKKHFVLNQPPKRFDVFNMILHSVWLRRLNLRLRLPSM
ncbi:Exostosin family protein [Rhynchospora pubera]|uniref:Exostosin family protein n=1 Tax=Rhynchospora pubera TaxID=906938 RepID=A0AAV8GA40_9POAL|nr:Exostosin family protein [Rhynchospora pubera]